MPKPVKCRTCYDTGIQYEPLDENFMIEVPHRDCKLL